MKAKTHELRPWWRRPPWRTLLLLFAPLMALAIAYGIWSPGKRVADGRHDRGTNAVWMQHSWLADDRWCAENDRVARCAELRAPARIESEFAQLSAHGVRYVYPHVAPVEGYGRLPGVDAQQMQRVLDAAARHSIQVVPWIGGVWQQHVFPEEQRWRRRFVGEVVDLLRAHPRLAGVQINIEPLPSGDDAFVTLLQELRDAMHPSHVLGVAAYPPAPFARRTSDEVFWSIEYLARVAGPADQVALMMYDAGYPLQKFYVSAVAKWTRDALRAALDAEVLLGVPAYDDHGVPWHDPRVENVRTSLRGIHAGLADLEQLPENYLGITVYAEWETDEREWRDLRQRFLRERTGNQ